MRFKSFYLLSLSLVAIARTESILDQYTKNPDGVYHGRFTRDVHEPEFLVPRHVDQNGKFNSYELPRYYDHSQRERNKRSLDSEAEKLNLLLPFNGIEHHVELYPYHDFISPELVIETRGPGSEKSLNEGLRFDRAADLQCHYRGQIRGHPNSRAALSLCDGVVGYVQTNDGRFFIEPVNDAEPTSDGQHVHMAYRRQAPHEKDSGDGSAAEKSRCGTNENWETAWARQLAKREQVLAASKAKKPKKVFSGTHSIHRYLEIGIVCDRRFLDYHKNNDYEKYLLTVMNMVSDYYHDVSSGNQMDIVVVRIIYLENERKEVDLEITQHAENTLASFAKWADKMNPKDHKHPNHWDIGALVSRHDLCGQGTACDLLGLAYVAAACDSEKSAAINEDSGLLLGIVMAHEIGHVMGCAHDEQGDVQCPAHDKDQSCFVMSPYVMLYTIRWSPCSRKFITTFLESGLGECLNDDPRNPPDKYRLPMMLPGAMYNADQQCDFEHTGNTYCDLGRDKVCSELWCRQGSKCVSKGSIPVDGTKCGHNKWCIRKKCVDMGSRPEAVNGGWGAWGKSSGCSRTCGGGVKTVERECDRPTPANGGRFCLGERKKITLCNTTPCDPSKPPFRSVQCAAFNDKPVTSDNVLHQWKAHMLKEEPCALFCLNEVNVFMKLAPTTENGTPCKGGTNNLCVFGSCRKVGCDWIIDSSAVEDKCGICKGDGTRCSIVEGDFTKTRLSDYQKVVMIPKGSRSITVIEKGPSTNTLAVKYERGNKYCLNENHMEARDGDYECAGSMVVYSHPAKQKEELYMRGPLIEDIEIQYVFYSPRENPGIHYSYYVKSSGSTSSGGYKGKYSWDFTEWGECSAKCGGGTAISNPSCIEEKNGLVSPDFCQDMPRPDPKSRVCNANPCKARWRVSQWSRCSACDGKSGLQHRKVLCIKPASSAGGDDVEAPYSACKGRVPKQEKPCKGTRPCKKTCPKRSENCEESELLPDPKEQERALAEQRRMIDNLVDLSLARYVEKTRQNIADFENRAMKRDVSESFKNLLRDWAMIGEDMKNKRTCNTTSGQNNPELLQIGGGDVGAALGFTTPKPGSIVKDIVPQNELVLFEAPVKNEAMQSNISDAAFQEAGDIIPMGIDQEKEKVYHGEQAVNMLSKNPYGTTKKEPETTEPPSSKSTDETKPSNHESKKPIRGFRI